MQAICVPRALVGSAFVGPSTVLVDGGRIERVQPGTQPPAGTDVVRLDDGFLTAGLVDLQVNGGFGVDFAAATPDDWRQVSRRLLATGVTAYVPTFITAPVGELATSLDAVDAAQQAQRSRGEEPAARILGAHLEGPFISAARAGAHDPALMVDADDSALSSLLGTPERRAALRIVTLAPERPGALEAIARLVAAGVVVSIGHTDAGGPVARSAADAGASLVTHLFNAMRPLTHRDESLPAAVLVDGRFHLGLIADLVHLAPDVVRLVLQVAPHRAVLVTDAAAPAGAPAGSYVLGAVQVTTTELDPLPRRADGVLAGSVLTLDQAVRNVAGLGIALEQALLAATRNPADAVGRPDLGRLEAGAAADLVWWSDDLAVRRTWVGGQPSEPSPRAGQLA